MNSLRAFENYIVCIGNPTKLAEYLRLVGPFEYEKRFLAPSGSRRAFSSEYFGSIPGPDVSDPNRLTLLHGMMARKEYIELATEIAQEKVKWVFEKMLKPVIVEAVVFCADGLAGFPGISTEDCEGSEGNMIIAQRANSGNRIFDVANNHATAVSVLAAMVDHEHELQFRSGSVSGTIVLTDSSKLAYGWDAIFVPEGSPNGQTFRELGISGKNKLSMRAAAASAVRENPFLDPKDVEVC